MSLLQRYQQHWQLKAKQVAFLTSSSILQAVFMQDNRTAMLKIALNSEEKTGNHLLKEWEGQGAARVYDLFEDAILLEYTDGPSLLSLALDGYESDIFASQIIHHVVSQLHQTKNILPDLVSLSSWFEPLTSSNHSDTLVIQAEKIARPLLLNPVSKVPLHGDSHHSNILKFSQGWLAIDPKGLIGEHYYDYLPIFCNPDLGALTVDSLRFNQQLDYVCQLAHLKKQRLVDWIVAYSALSSLWFIENGNQISANNMLKITAFALEN